MLRHHTRNVNKKPSQKNKLKNTMIKKSILKHTLLGTLLSILVFFSISFITFLTNINPFRYYGINESYHLEIGFPFTYYYEILYSGSISPNTQWNLSYLFYDCLITWVIVTGAYVLTKRLRKK